MGKIRQERLGAHVAILMTVYNGMPYIKEQINSILNQTYDNWDLIISDDGSSDGSVEYLNYICARNNNIHLYKNNGRHGAYNNYWQIISQMQSSLSKNYEYYFFCDQDDIWVDNKIETQIKSLKELEDDQKKIPVAVYSDLQLIDANGKQLNTRISNYSEMDLSSHPLNIFFSHVYTWGTTLACNRALFFMVVPPYHNRNVIAHDHYFAEYAVLYGKIKYINIPLVYYRRHEKNVSIVPPKYNCITAAKRLLFDFPSIVNNHGQIYRASIEMLSVAPQTPLVHEMKTALEVGGVKGIKFIEKYRICPSKSLFNRICIRFVMFFKLYKLSYKYKITSGNDSL